MHTPYYLLTAGCNLFPNLPGDRNLRGCIADAHRMQETLVDAFGDPVRYRILENPTRAEFVAALTIARDMAVASDVEIVDVSISTHGMRIGSGSPGNACTALVFSDATPSGNGLLPDWQLNEILDSFPRKCLVEFWADTCHSGTITRATGLVTSYPRAIPRFIPASVFAPQPAQRIRAGRGLGTLSRGAETGQGSNIVAWGGCLDSEQSMDVPDGNGGYCGIFTKSFCDVFNANEEMSRRAMLPLVTAAIAESGYLNQHPTLSDQRSGGA